MTAPTFPLLFSGCFVMLLLGGHTTVVCLVDEKLAALPTTTAGYYPTNMMVKNVTYGEPTFPLACQNASHYCNAICEFCSGFGAMKCLEVLFEHKCVADFNLHMGALNYSDWCVWGNVRGLYSNLSLCTEDISDCVLIPWPNPLVEQIFVGIHSQYFKDCPSEELSDPPPVIVFTLVIIPICLIPLMVSLVVLKTKNGDGSS